MDEAVYGGDCHDAVGEDDVLLTERLIGGDDQTAGFIAVGDEFEQDLGFRIGFLDATDVVNDEDAIFVQPGHGGHQIEIALSLLEALHHGGGAEGLARPDADLRRRRYGFCRRRKGR